MGERFKTLTPYLLFGIITLLIILMFKDCKGSLGKPETRYIYKTDSIFKDEYYALKKLYDQKTPPKTVTEYLPPIIIIDTIYTKGDNIIVKVKDEDTLKVNKQFIANYPDARKLIEFKLKRDVLEMTTFDKDARIFKDEYPLYLDEYNYQYYDNTLHRENTSYPTNNSVKWNQLFFNGGYSQSQKQPILGLEYNLSYRRFKLDVDTDISIEQNPNFSLQAKIGYRLFD